MNKAESQPEETKIIPEGIKATTAEKVKAEAVTYSKDAPSSRGGTTAAAAPGDPDDEATDKPAGKDSAKKKRKTTDSFKPRRKKPRDAPRRPLSAYNIYFRDARAALIARNDAGNPDKDFAINLDAVVATGKKRDDPSAVFQAAARTLAARWKTMDPNAKAEYEQAAEEEMKRYRARVYEYETRMVEEARSKTKSEVALDVSTSSRGGATQDPRVDTQSTANLNAQLLGGGAGGLQFLGGGLPLQGQSGLGYALLQPGVQALGGLAGRSLLQQVPNEALLQLLQAQNGRGLTYGGLGAGQLDVLASQRFQQEQMLAALQRESFLHEQLQAARFANTPVAMTIIPPPGVGGDQQLLAQLLERDRLARGGDSSGNRPRPN